METNANGSITSGAAQNATSSSNKVSKNMLRAIVLPREDRAKTVPIQKIAANGEDPGATKQLPEDPFAALAESDQILEPPFDLLTLSMLVEHSTEMRQCVEAMEVNIDGLGHRLIPRVRTEAGDAAQKEAVNDERVRLENFFTYVSLDDSFTGMRRKVRFDLETTGNGYLEVIRSPKGEIQGFEHAQSYLVRLGRQETNAFEVKTPILELQNDGSVKVVEQRAWKRFRTYAQTRAIHRRGISVSTSSEVVFFKEFGDPRVYDSRSGKVVPDDQLDKFPDDLRANEMIHFRIYTPRSPYGLPRFIGNLLSIFGDRAADEINFLTFKNNNIPSMAVLVSNGQLTEGTIQRITEFVEAQIQGQSNYSKFLVIEAESATESDMGEDAGAVKVNIQPLTKEQHTDAMFVNYSKANADKLRRSWRLPPIFVGSAAEYTRATADTSRRLADEQVFAPERDEFDNTMNRRVFPVMGVLYHRFRSNTPNTTDNKELVSILSDAEKTGGMTPAIARDVLEEILGRDLPDFPSNFPADLPFSLLMADAVKNQASPVEPGQQVTAIKDGDIPAGDKAAAVKDPVDFVNGLLQARERLEASWRGLIGDREPAHDHTEGGDGGVA